MSLCGPVAHCVFICYALLVVIAGDRIKRFLMPKVVAFFLVLMGLEKRGGGLSQGQDQNQCGAVVGEVVLKIKAGAQWCFSFGSAFPLPQCSQKLSMFRGVYVPACVGIIGPTLFLRISYVLSEVSECVSVCVCVSE